MWDCDPANDRNGSRVDEPQSLPAVTTRDSSTPSNGPGSEILSDWRFVPRRDSCTATTAMTAALFDHLIGTRKE